MARFQKTFPLNEQQHEQWLKDFNAYAPSVSKPETKDFVLKAIECYRNNGYAVTVTPSGSIPADYETLKAENKSLNETIEHLKEKIPDEKSIILKAESSGMKEFMNSANYRIKSGKNKSIEEFISEMFTYIKQRIKSSDLFE